MFKSFIKLSLYSNHYKIIIKKRIIYKLKRIIEYMPEIIIKKKGWKCLKCGHEWLPKKNFNKNNPPIVCPNCNNPRWNISPKRSNKYYLTKKGKNFNLSDTKYSEIEIDIIDILKDNKKSFTELSEINNKIKEEDLKILQKEGLIKK